MALCTEAMALAPSPVAAATRFIEPEWTSPTANTPGMLVVDTGALEVKIHALLAASIVPHPSLCSIPTLVDWVVRGQPLSFLSQLLRASHDSRNFLTTRTSTSSGGECGIVGRRLPMAVVPDMPAVTTSDRHGRLARVGSMSRDARACGLPSPCSPAWSRSYTALPIR